MFNDKQYEILKKFSEQSDLLFSKGIIRSDSFTGEIGEYFVSTHFNLIRTDRSKRAVDAKDASNKTYQIKAKVINNNNFSFTINDLNIQDIDYLSVIYFNDLYEPIKLVRINKKYLLGEHLTLSNHFFERINCEQIFGNCIKVPKEIRNEINKFGEYFNLLKSLGIIKSRHIVGDIGEFYACKVLGLKLLPKGFKGSDAVDNINQTYEIKTRRVYQSGRRNSETRRLNNLVAKNADFLIVVVLDKSFCCNGMWKMPLKNVINPKSANLSIIKSTKGVVELFPTTIDWL